MKKMKNKIGKVSGGNSEQIIDLVKRTESTVSDKNGAEITASTSNLKVGGNLNMLNLDQRHESESSNVHSTEKITEVTAGIGKG